MTDDGTKRVAHVSLVTRLPQAEVIAALKAKLKERGIPHTFEELHANGSYSITIPGAKRIGSSEAGDGAANGDPV